MGFFTLDQFKTMCFIQDELNQVVHPRWEEQKWPWWLAITDEVMEFNKHLGWEWWKVQSESKVTNWQLLLEVVDMLCFTLSSWLEGEEDFTGKALFDWLEKEVEFDTDLTLTEISEQFLVKSVSKSSREDIAYLVFLAEKLGYTADQFFHAYMAKVVLNKFRQDNGYKTGHYQKNWKVSLNEKEKEDNQWLEQVIQSLEFAGAEFTQATIYNALEHMYSLRVRAV